MHRIAVLPQRHHRIALLDAPALVFIQRGLADSEQLQRETKLFAAFQLGQPQRLLGHRVAQQFIAEQIHGSARQLLADLAHLTDQHQLRRGADQAVNLRRMGAALAHQHLSGQQAGARRVVQRLPGQGLQLQGNPQQALQLAEGAAPRRFILRFKVVGHQPEGALGQTLAVLVAAHLIYQVQSRHPQQRYQHQSRQHAAIDAQKDRIHSACAAWATNR